MAETSSEKKANYSDYEIGKKDSHGVIISEIYHRGEKYIIYNTKEKGLFKYDHDFEDIVSAPIEEKLFEATNLLKTNRMRKKFCIPITAAFKLCLENKEELSQNYFDTVIKKINNYKNVKNTIEYLTVCIVVVIIGIATSYFLYDEYKLNSTVSRLILIATAGSIGGFLSISLRINELIEDVFFDRVLNFLSAIIRMMFSVLAGVVTYFLIRSNIVFGFLEDLEINFFVILTLAIASGFFEKKIPDILKKIG